MSSKLWVLLGTIVVVTGTASSSDLTNIENVSSLNGGDINFTDGIDLNGNNLVSPNQVDGVDLDDPGTALQKNGDQLQVNTGAFVDRDGDTVTGSINMDGNAIDFNAASNANPPTGAIKDTGYVELVNQEDQDLPNNNQFTLFADHSEGLQYNDNGGTDRIIASQNYVNTNDDTVQDNQGLPDVLNNDNSANQNINLNTNNLTNTNTIQFSGRPQIGANSQATGTDAIAIGPKTAATNSQSMAIGQNSGATGSNGVAVGYFSDADATNTLSVGTVSSAFERDATALGYAAKATIEDATAVGRGSEAKDDDTTAIGEDSLANAASATAIGQDSDATATGATALGLSSEATAKKAVAIGSRAQAPNANEATFGAFDTDNQGNSNRLDVNVTGNLTVHQNIDLTDNNLTNTNTITFQNNPQIGQNSEATGGDSIAIGRYAQARRQGDIAIGENAFVEGATLASDDTPSIAIGKNSGADKKLSVAIGESSEVNASRSVSIGEGSKTSNLRFGSTQYATNDRMVALGSNSYANGDEAIAIGSESYAYNAGAIAIGDFSNATNPGGRDADTSTVAIGGASSATGEDAIALGTDSNATSQAATALGVGSEATSQAATALGSGSDATSQNAVALGTLSGARGDDATAIGTSSDAAADYATTLGGSSQATNLKSTALGQDSQATSANATALGQNSQANNLQTTALGQKSTATANRATAVGQASQATGNEAAALGTNSKATNFQATAVGTSSQATSDKSTALGTSSQATKLKSTALGRGSQATGEDSTALGQNSQATNFATTALGQDSQATKTQTTALGASSSATGIGTTALGRSSQATALGAMALGPLSEATATGAVAIGQFSKAPNNYEATFGNLGSEKLDVNVTGKLTVHGDINQVPEFRSPPSSLSTVLNNMQGSGTTSDPYVINNIHQLQAIGSSTSSHYELGSDVDASGTEYWDNYKGNDGFFPIAADQSGGGFTGTLDGNGHDINGLHMTRETPMGLFGKIREPANVTDLGIINAKVNRASSASSTFGHAVLVGLLNDNPDAGEPADIRDVHTSGATKGGSRAGGLVGFARQNQDLRIINSHNDADIRLTQDPSGVGGLIGYYDAAGDLVISSSHNSGDISYSGGTDNIGGLLGKIPLGSSQSKLRLRDSYSDGEIAGGKGIFGTSKLGLRSTTFINRTALRGSYGNYSDTLYFESELLNTQQNAEDGKKPNFAELVAAKKGFTVVTDNEVEFDQTGTYKIDYSVNFHRTGSGGRNVMNAGLNLTQIEVTTINGPITGPGKLPRSKGSCYIRTNDDGDECDATGSAIVDVHRGSRLKLFAEEERGFESGNDIERASVSIHSLN